MPILIYSETPRGRRILDRLVQVQIFDTRRAIDVLLNPLTPKLSRCITGPSKISRARFCLIMVRLRRCAA